MDKLTKLIKDAEKFESEEEYGPRFRYEKATTPDKLLPILRAFQKMQEALTASRPICIHYKECFSNFTDKAPTSPWGETCHAAVAAIDEALVTTDQAIDNL